MCLKKKINFLVSKVKDILVDISVYNFPGKIFQHMEIAWSRQGISWYLKENGPAPPPHSVMPLSQV